MRKWVIVSLLALVIAFASCGKGETRSHLGKEVVLAPGEQASFVGEDLTIKFLGVSGDSRCPMGARCVWAGEAKCEIELTSGGTATRLTLTELGLTDAAKTEAPAGYVLSFHITPYPEVGKKIAPEKYRLHLTATRATPTPP